MAGHGGKRGGAAAVAPLPHEGHAGEVGAAGALAELLAEELRGGAAARDEDRGEQPERERCASWPGDSHARL